MAWRIVHAARLMPPAPPGASGNPIELLSSGSSSPEHVVAAREVARLREIALASKPHWCAELSFSLGVEKDYVAQVFDLYQPRNLNTLEVYEHVRQHSRRQQCKRGWRHSRLAGAAQQRERLGNDELRASAP
jgi:hypothetical protein